MLLRSSGTGNGTRAAQPAAGRKFWGWGLEGQGLTVTEIEQLGAVFAVRFGIDGMRVELDPAGVMNPGVLMQSTRPTTHDDEGQRR